MTDASLKAMATWLSASSSHNHNHHKPPDDEYHSHTSSLAKDMFNGLLKAPSRSHTPLSASAKSRAVTVTSQPPVSEPEPFAEEDPQVIRFKRLYEESEAKISSLFSKTGDLVVPEKRKVPESFDAPQVPDIIAPQSQSESKTSAPPSKKRKIEDDYDDYDDDDDEEEDELSTSASPLKGKSAKVQIVADRHASPVPRPAAPSRPSSDASKSETAKQKEKPEDARKKLEEAKRLEGETVKNMSRQFFFTLENDRDALLDQQRLEEAERRAEAEAEGNAKGQNPATQQGSLSNANLGASSLTLKNLIARIDMYRSEVQASESELRALMSEVRKNRSKWASEEKVGQEELYEAAEKVMNELKAQFEHSSPFLNPVKKKDAPDYHIVIKAPMDMGTMTKKLKQLAYKSKQEFVDDLHLIWTNCLKYNSAADHPMRKHALFMRKETDKLVPLIPDIVIRDRAEIEAEERKQRIANGEFDENAEDSDDDQPIMASRGRAAPSKKVAKTAAKAPNASHKTTAPDSTPVPESKPSLSQVNVLTNGIRAESEIDTGSQGHSTPPPGVLTPTGPDRGAGSVIDAASEMPDSEVPVLNFPTTPPELEDEEHSLWKQKTKKERAMVAAARHRLFRGDKLNPDEEALLRTKSGMRRWQRLQQDPSIPPSLQDIADSKQNQAQRGTMLAEGFEPEQDLMLPDYYDSLAAIPNLNSRLAWETDTEGQVIEQNEEYLTLFPKGRFTAPQSKLAAKMADNMRQIQETRKIVSKIGIVKQMQIQTQMYQNQFSKYEPAPFYETDVQDHVMNDDGPVMAPWVSKAALSRSIGQIFFHAGFEEFQPSALDVVADLAGEFFQRICSNFADYLNEEKIPVAAPIVVPSTTPQKIESQNIKPSLQPTVSREEAVLHALHETGFSLNDLDYYAHEEMDRTSQRLQTMYDRMRSHYAELLKPALSDDTAQGSGSFETGEQYVGGDFADDLGEDFFGFKELGLDREFGLVNLSVPLHLLHNRLSSAAQQNNTNPGESTEKLFVPPSAYARVNVENVEHEIGLVKTFFKKRLKENGDRPLPEDLDLPVKQRKGYGRARVPATGKIGDGKLGASPQKKAAPASKADNKPVSKIALTNGAKDDKKKMASPALDVTMTDGDLDNDNGPPSPSQNQDDADRGFSPEKSQKTPSRAAPVKQRPANIRKNSETANPPTTNGHRDSMTNGNTTEFNDFSNFMNGMDSPPPSANGTEPSSENAKGLKKTNSKTKGKGKAKGNDDDGDGGMISPESL